MVATRQHDLYALFAFALSENDWGLADAVASWLLDRERDPARLDAIVKRAANRQGAPDSLGLLTRWAAIAQEVERPEEFE